MKLRSLMRTRPTLPVKMDGTDLTVSDIQSGMRLPLYSCPFKDPFKNYESGACNYHTSDRTAFIHHICGGAMDPTHQEAISSICPNDIANMGRFDYIHGALAVAEQERWPRIGLSITRRALNLLAHRYNDEKIQCLVCFVCAQTRTTCAGYPTVNLKSTKGAANSYHTEINYYKEANLCDLERNIQEL